VPGERFTPPPDWDAGFEFSGRGADGMDAGDFSDFFAELFGRMGQPTRRRRAAATAGAGGGFSASGEDHHAKILLDIEDAWRGASAWSRCACRSSTRKGGCSWRAHARGRIPAGVKAGQMIRLAGQGGPGLGTGRAGDLLLEVHSTRIRAFASTAPT
jgi:curved DNA-binding protein